MAASEPLVFLKIDNPQTWIFLRMRSRTDKLVEGQDGPGSGNAFSGPPQTFFFFFFLFLHTTVIG